MKSLILFLLILQSFVFANIQNAENKQFTLQDKKESLLEKEKAYQEYEKQKELENQKPKDNGFSICCAE